MSFCSCVKKSNELKVLETSFSSFRIDSKPTSRLLKTGKLIQVSVVAGGMVAGASEIQLQSLGAYAAHIGLAFQVADDILNVTGDPERLGKATGTDQARGKNTYPLLIGLGSSQRLAGQLVDKALNALDAFDKKADPLRAIARYVVERKR